MLLLADARFPAGAHAHSGGMEPSHGAGDVRTEADVESFVRGRLATAGRVEAAFAARACELAMRDAAPEAWRDLDGELAARTPSPRLRTTARTLGRQLLRAGERVWPSATYSAVRAALSNGAMQPLALGAVADAAGLTPQDAALCSLHHLVAAATTAAVRLTGFDPFTMTALAARLAPELERLAAEATSRTDLPATTSPLADILAEHHSTWEVRLFAS
jgi:urease accessory protein